MNEPLIVPMGAFGGWYGKIIVPAGFGEKYKNEKYWTMKGDCACSPDEYIYRVIEDDQKTK